MGLGFNIHRGFGFLLGFWGFRVLRFRVTKSHFFSAGCVRRWTEGSRLGDARPLPSQRVTAYVHPPRCSHSLMNNEDYAFGVLRIASGGGGAAGNTLRNRGGSGPPKGYFEVQGGGFWV
jgi:hypothetical protein